MKLLEQQSLPVGRGRRGCVRSQNVLESLGQIRLPQKPLQAAVMALLIGPARGTTAVQLEIELIAPHRQLRRQRLEPS